MHSIAGYHISSILTDGEEMIVYRALRSDDKRRILIKTTRSEYPSLKDIARLKHEYEIARELHVDGAVEAIGLEKFQQSLILLLHEPGGQTLSDVVAAGTIDLARFLSIAIRLAEIVAELHQSNLIHQEIRPENILVEGDALHIMGFGSALRLTRSGQQLTHGAVSTEMLPYMSPEQTGRTDRTVDYRTDLYSLGVTFYEMLTGAPPFQQADPIELVHAHVALRPTPPAAKQPLIPRVVSNIAMRLLEKNAEERYQSAHGLKVDLENCLTQLRTTGRVETFPLALHDFPDQLPIPQKLYGRETELSVLATAFERTSAGASEVVMVTGSPGVGKSTLVRKMRPKAAEQKGYFVSGKFDQLQRNVPYTALIEVCRDLIRQLLTGSDAEIERWRVQLLEVLGPSAPVITDVVPELELILGPQPALPPLPPTESQNRFNLAWQKFLGAFSREGQPLVIFLDDLQWADSASLSLIQNRMTDPGNRHLLLIGAYRSQEAGASHPLQMMLRNLEEKDVPTARVSLEPLGVEHLAALLSDTLHVEAGAAAPFAELLFQKTNGNPLSAIETLKELFRRGLVAFDLQHGRWTWDLADIREVEIAENVVDLMIDKIRQLHSRSQIALQIASCIGNTFDSRTLAVAGETSVEETEDDLSEAIDEGLIMPPAGFSLRAARQLQRSGPGESREGTYRFLHDRVQQAAYASIDDEEKSRMHLRIGRLLRASAGDPQEKLFEVVNHLNFASALITSPDERMDLAGLNLLASRRAKAATAFEVALSYARTGIDFLDDVHWQSHYDITLALHLERAECEYLIGQFDTAEALCTDLLEKARSDEDRVRVYNLRIALNTSLSRYEEAVRIGITAARLLGLSLPERPGQAHIIREFMTAKWRLRGRKKADLMNLPSMMDRHQLARVDLLMSLTAPAFLSSEVFAILISLKLFNLSLKHGLSKATPYGYMVYAVVNAGLGNVTRASEFGEMALSLRRQIGHAEQGHILPFLFATAVNHWNRHARTNLDYLVESYQASLDAGDLIYADYCLITMVVNSNFMGDSLDQVWERCDQYADFFTRIKRSTSVDTAQRQAETLQRQHILSLRGQTSEPAGLSDEHFDEEAFLSEPKAPLVMLEYYTKKLQLLYLFEKQDSLEETIRKSAKVIKDVRITGDIRVSDHFFYAALASAAKKTGPLKGVRENQRQLRKWAEGCPENFLHKALLVEAEEARTSGRDRKAMDLYDRAIASAREHDYVHVEALANELAAKFYVSIGKEQLARPYLTAARYGYMRWGAIAKVNELNRTFSHLLPQGVTGVDRSEASLEMIDLTTVAKASQAISEEIVLERLIDRMMTIVIENAGAQKGYFVLEDAQGLVIEAEGVVGEGEVRLVGSVPVNSTDLLSRAIVHYVARTRESVVLRDASSEGLFTGDGYVTRHRPKSILCMPLVHQGQLAGILYLENNLATGAFTPERLEVLRLLSAQIAISIENARLYKSLERKVEQRTEELQSKNLDLESALRNLKATQAQLIQAEKMASLGQLTAGIAHEIKNPLNFVTNFSALTAELIEEIEEEAEKHPDMTLSEIRDLLDDVKLNVRKIEEHGRRGDGIVRSMLEHSRATKGERTPVNVNALLEEYLNLAYHSMRAQDADFKVTLEKEFDTSVRPIDLVPQEIGRVILNLFNNAFYAVHKRGKAEGDGYAPTIKVSTRIDEGMLEIRVEDNGQGMSEETRGKVFEPFFTTKPTGEGTGLGLSLSFEIITRGYGGTLSVESREGAGATFFVRLPVSG